MTGLSVRRKKGDWVQLKPWPWGFFKPLFISPSSHFTKTSSYICSSSWEFMSLKSKCSFVAALFWMCCCCCCCCCCHLPYSWNCFVCGNVYRSVVQMAIHTIACVNCRTRRQWEWTIQGRVWRLAVTCAPQWLAVGVALSHVKTVTS